MSVLSVHTENACFAIAGAEALPFPDHSFDTVVDSMSLCTFSDPVQALREVARVCRLDGRLLFLEHGRSDRGWLGRLQDRRATRHAERRGCDWNREPLELVRQADPKVMQSYRTFLGILYEVEARPGCSVIQET